MRSKAADPRECVARVRDGASIMVGGFGTCGIPESLVRLLVEHGARDLTIISNDAGGAERGAGLLVRNGQVGRMISTWVGESADLERAMSEGTLRVQLVPQGTFAERLRAGGAGIAGFYTATGVGTAVEEGKEKRIFGGREYLLEMPLSADFAFVKAWKGDEAGNLVYRRTARNLNPLMATAADATFAEVETLVKAGELDPDLVHTPGLYVDAIFQGDIDEKRIGRGTHR